MNSKCLKTSAFSRLSCRNLNSQKNSLSTSKERASDNIICPENCRRLRLIPTGFQRTTRIETKEIVRIITPVFLCFVPNYSKTITTKIIGRPPRCTDEIQIAIGKDAYHLKIHSKIFGGKFVRTGKKSTPTNSWIRSEYKMKNKNVKN